MKLKNLLSQLQEFDPEMEILVEIDSGEDGITDIEKVYKTDYADHPEAPDNILII